MLLVYFALFKVIGQPLYSVTKVDITIGHLSSVPAAGLLLGVKAKIASLLLILFRMSVLVVAANSC